MPRSPKGRGAARGLDARLSSNTLSCLLEMLHLKEFRSIKMLIDSNHGIYRDLLHPARDCHGCGRCLRLPRIGGAIHANCHDIGLDIAKSVF
jgi:hypothetical protein